MAQAEYAWKDGEVVILGRPLVRILDFQYNTEVDKTAIYGRGNKVLGIQTGNEKNTGSITVGQSELEALINASPGKKLTNLVVDINFAYISEVLVVRDRAVSANFTAMPKQLKQGDPAMEVVLPFIALDIQYNI